MSLLTRIIGGPAERKAMDSAGLAELLLGRTSKSGAQVSQLTALRVATVFGCCRVLAEDVSKVPLGLYQDRPGGAKERATSHPLHQVLARRPNPWMTSMEFRETLMFHAVLAHGGFAFINRVKGEVRELLPLIPSSVRVIQQGWDVRYQISDARGVVGEYGPEHILRIHGPSWNAVAGFDLITQAQEAIGLSMSAEESQARMHSNGVRPSGILTTDNKLSQEAVDRIRGQTQDAYGGGQNALKMMVLDAGLKFQAMSMTGVDAQHLETRKHQIEEVCRFFRVHPQKVFHSSNTSTFASVESFAMAHVGDSLLPWFTRWEQALDRDLLSEKETGEGYYCHHVVQGLLRGDAASRSNYYKAAVNDGWMTRNEVRQLEELNPLDGLDDPLKPLNMETVEPDGADDQAEDAGEGGMGAGASDVAGAAAVQDTALNGAQVASLLAILQEVAAGRMPAATARAVIVASFPGVAETTVDAMLVGLADFEPAAPPPGPAPAAEGAKSMAAALAEGMTAIGVGLAAKSPEELTFTFDATGKCVGLKPKEG